MDTKEIGEEQSAKVVLVDDLLGLVDQRIQKAISEVSILKEPEKKNVFKEAWEDSRQVVKVLIQHAFFFILLPVLIVLFHFIYSLLGLPDEYSAVVRFFEFIGTVSAFIILTFGLTIDLVLIIWKKMDGGSNEK